MKKTILLSAMAVAAAMTVSAKTADELRIYINPGHGSFTADDRPMGLVPNQKSGANAYDRYNTDTTMFYESNTDLEKGFGVLERLIEYGIPFDRTKNQTGELWQIGAARDLEQNIVMSRVKNGPFHDDNGTANQLGSKAPADLTYYNRNLSEICEEVMANNFDMFISIHSNAASEGSTANYPLYLYRGYDDLHAAEGVSAEHQKLSRAMADASWPYAIGNPHMVWTSYLNSKNLRGDINFYGGGSTATRQDGTKVYGYLGVLKHTTPGFLVEGYFHTYTVARHRAMNWDVCRVEGIAYARGIADYFGLEKEKYGTVYGIVRDLHEKFSDVNYKPNPSSDDIYRPINGATVKLMKGDQVVATKVTDNFYNGAFVFDGVEPGEYTIVVSHPDYKDIAEYNKVDVLVSAAQDTYPKLFIENVNYEIPTEALETYPDPASTIAGVEPTTEYKFEEVYGDKAVEALEGKTVRRTLVHQDKVYTLALDAEKNPTIVVVDAENGELLAEVSTEGMLEPATIEKGVAADMLKCSDIQVSADHYLLAINKTETTFGNGGKVTIYKWENDEDGLPTGAPQIFVQETGPGMSGNYYNAYAGETFAIDGTTEDGKIYVTTQTIGAAKNFRIGRLTLTAGMVSANEYARPVIGGATTNFVSIDESTRLYASPNSANNFILGISGQMGSMPEYNFVAGAVDTEGEDLPADLKPANAANLSIFKYAGANYVAVPVVEDNQNVGVTILDITKGMKNAVQVGTINTTLEAAEGTGIAAGNVGTTYDKVNDVYTSAWLNLYAMRDNKLTKLTTRNVAQPAYKAGMAYNLESTRGEWGDMIVAYAISEDAQSANLILTPLDSSVETEDGLPVPGEDMVYPVEATKGDHQFTVPAADLEDGMKYNYRIEVTSSSPAAGEVFADYSFNDRRGGVITITDDRYNTYGYTLVGHGKNAGIDIYNPAGEKVADKKWAGHSLWGGPNNTNQSDPFRGHQREGKAVFGAWGDKACGLVVVDPLQNDEPQGMFAGQNSGTGCYIYDGVKLGGGNAGLCFVGEGDNTRLYMFSEDHENSNGKGSTENSVVRYDIGSAWLITEAPKVVGFKSLLANGQGEMIAYGNGFFVAQTRDAGNNAKGCPVFAYIETETETQTFDSGEKLPELNSGLPAVAITTDGKKLAVSEADKIHIYDVTWNGNVPSMTENQTIPTSASLDWIHMRFDAAGNLHTYERNNGGYHVYALRGQHTATTQASTNMTTTGLDKIAADNATEGTAVYYNLNGVRVADTNMVPGIYVKVVNGNATKVVIR